MVHMVKGLESGIMGNPHGLPFRIIGRAASPSPPVSPEAFHSCRGAREDRPRHKPPPGEEHMRLIFTFDLLFGRLI